MKNKEIKEHEKKEEPKIDAKQQQIEELTGTLQRLQADFENYKKRVDKENKEFKKYVEADLVRKLLPILDNFEIALKNTSNKDEFIKGIELIFSSFFQALEDMGLKKIEINGKFDPYRHEVLLTQECDKDEGTILEELQKGYSFKDIIIRHSKVKVAKQNPRKAKAFLDPENPPDFHGKTDEGKCDEKNK